MQRQAPWTAQLGTAAEHQRLLLQGKHSDAGEVVQQEWRLAQDKLGSSNSNCRQQRGLLITALVLGRVARMSVMKFSWQQQGEAFVLCRLCAVLQACACRAAAATELPRNPKQQQQQSRSYVVQLQRAVIARLCGRHEQNTVCTA
jgi:hypothetical protein